MADVLKYLGNLGRSIKYSAVDQIKEMTPAIGSFFDTNNDTIKDTYRSISGIKDAFGNRVGDTMSDVNPSELAGKFKNNLISDLKTGKFYNKERKDSANDEMMNKMFGGFDDYGFEDDDFSTSYSGSSDSYSDTDEMTSMMDIVGEKSSMAVANATVRSAEYMVEANRQSTKILYSQNNILFNKLHSDLGTINSNMSNIVDFMGKSTTAHYENSKNFFEISNELDKERNAILKEMLEIQKSLYKPEKKDTKRTKSFSDLMNAEGMIDLDAMKDHIKDNLSNKSGGIFDMVSMIAPVIVDDVIASPLKVVTDQLVKKTIPQMLKDSVKEFDKTLSGVFATSMMNLNNYNGNNFILEQLKDVLGFNSELKKEVSTNKYNKGPVPFDGITRKSIVEVIPTYLSKIYATLSGTKESRYNYSTGKFVNLADVEDSLNKSIQSKANYAASDIQGFFNEYTKKLKMSQDELTQFQEDIQQIFLENFKNAKIFTGRGKKASDLGLKGGKKSEINLKIYKEFWDQLPESVKMQYANEIYSQREAHTNSMYELEQNADDVIFNLMNDSQKMGSSSTSSSGKKAAAAASSLSFPEFKNDVLFYLNEIRREISYIRTYGLSTSPVSAINGSGNQTNVPEFKSFQRSPYKLYNKKDDKSKSSNMKKVNKQINDNDNKINAIKYGKNTAEALKNIDLNAQKAESIYDFGKQNGQYGDYLKATNTDTILGWMASKSSGDFSEMLSGMDMLIRKPSEAISNLLNIADKQVYNLVFGVDDKNETGKGLLAQIMTQVEKSFDNFNMYINDNILGPLKNKFSKENMGEFVDKILGLFGLDRDKIKEFKDNLSDKIFGNEEKDEDGIFGGLFGDIKESFKKAGSDIYNFLIPQKIRDKFTKSRYRSSSETLKRVYSGFNNLTPEMEESLAQVENIYNTAMDPQYQDRNDDSLSDDDIINQILGYAKGRGTGGKRLAAVSKGEYIIPRFARGSANAAKNNIEDDNVILFENLKNRVKSKKGKVSKSMIKDIAKLSEEYRNKFMDFMEEQGSDPETQQKIKDGVNKSKNFIGQIGVEASKLIEVIDDMTSGLQDSIYNLFGKPEVDRESIKNAGKDIISNFRQYLPDMVVGGTIGGGVSLITGAIGGPLLGAAAGIGISLIKNSKALQNVLFGETDEDGNFQGGLVSKNIIDIFKQYAPGIAKGAIVGGATGLMGFPGGPLAGALVGSTVGFLSQNKAVQDVLFGSDGIWEDGDEKIKKALPRMGLGVLLGAAGLGGPFGLAGGAILGGLSGFITTTDSFTEFLFGPVADDGKRYGGLVGAIKTEVFDPLGKWVTDTVIDFKDWVKTDIIAPAKDFAKPFSQALMNGVKNLFNTFGDKVDKWFDKHVGMKISAFIEKSLNGGRKVLGTIIKLPINVGKAIVSAPFKGFGAIGNKIRSSQIAKGTATNMSAEERLQFRMTGEEILQQYNEENGTNLSMKEYNKLMGTNFKLNKSKFSKSLFGRDRSLAADKTIAEMSDEDIKNISQTLITANSNDKQLKSNLQLQGNQSISRLLGNISKEKDSGNIDAKLKNKLSKALTGKNKNFDKAENIIKSSNLDDSTKQRLLESLNSERKTFEGIMEQSNDLVGTRNKATEKIQDLLGSKFKGMTFEQLSRLMNGEAKARERIAKTSEEKTQEDQAENVDDINKTTTQISEKVQGMLDALNEQKKGTDEIVKKLDEIIKIAKHEQRERNNPLNIDPEELDDQGLAMLDLIMNNSSNQSDTKRPTFMSKLASMLGNKSQKLVSDSQGNITDTNGNPIDGGGKVRRAAEGIRRVKKTGVIAVSEGEMVVPPDMNPYNIAKRYKNEDKARKKFLNSIPMFAAGGLITNTEEDNSSMFGNAVNTLKGFGKKAKETMTTILHGIPVKMIKDGQGEWIYDKSDSNYKEAEKKELQEKLDNQAVRDSLTLMPEKISGSLSEAFEFISGGVDKVKETAAGFSNVLGKILGTPAGLAVAAAGVAIGMPLLDKLWTNTIKPFIDENITPIVSDAWNEHIKPGLSLFWEDTVQPGLKNYWQEDFKPFWSQVWKDDILPFIQEDLPGILGQVAATAVQNIPGTVIKFTGSFLDSLLNKKGGKDITIDTKDLADNNNVTTITDAQGRALTGSQVASYAQNGQPIYNEQGLAGYMDENGQIVFEDDTKPGTKSALTLAGAFGKSALLGKNSLGYKLASGISKGSGKLLGSKWMPAKLAGAAGKLISSPITAGAQVGDYALNVAQGKTIPGLIHNAQYIKEFGLGNFIKDSGTSQKVTSKLANTKAGKLATGITDKITSTKAGSFIADKFTSNAKNIATKAKDSGGKIGEYITKIISKAKTFMTEFLQNSTVLKKIKDVAKAINIPEGKFASWLSKFKGSLDEIIELAGKKASTAGTKIGATLASSAAKKAFAIGFAVVDFITGMDKAESMLGVKDTTVVEEFVCGITNVLTNLTIVLAIIPGTGFIAEKILEFFGDDINQRQEEAQAEVDAYNKEHNTNYTVEEYMSENKSIGGKVWGTVKKGASKVGNFFKNTGNNIKEGASNLVGGVKDLFNKDKDNNLNIIENIKNSNVVSSITNTVESGKKVLGTIWDELNKPSDLIAEGKFREYFDFDKGLEDSPLKFLASTIIGTTRILGLPTNLITAIGKKVWDVIEARTGNNGIAGVISTSWKKMNEGSNLIYQGKWSEYFDFNTNAETGKDIGIFGTIINAVGRLLNLPMNLVVGAGKWVGNNFDKILNGAKSIFFDVGLDSINAGSDLISTGDWSGYFDFSGSIDDISGFGTFKKILLGAGRILNLPVNAIIGAGKWVGNNFDNIIQNAKDMFGGLNNEVINEGSDLISKGDWSGYFNFGEGQEDQKFGTFRTIMIGAGRILNLPMNLVVGAGKWVGDKSSDTFDTISLGVSQIPDAVKSIMSYTKGDKDISQMDSDSTTKINTGTGFDPLFNMVLSIPKLITRIIYPLVNMGSTIKEGIGDSLDNLGDQWNNFWELAEGDNSKSGTGKSKYGRSKFGRAKQIDPYIKNIRFNVPGDSEYQTIGDSGCGPAAAVTAIQNISRYGRGDATVDAANYALSNGYKEINGGTKPGFFKDYFNTQGIDSTTSYNKSDIENNIKNGNTTVLMGKDGRGVNSTNPFGKNPHYVTVTGTDGKGNAIVQDPESNYDNQLYRIKDIVSKSSLGVSANGRSKHLKNGISRYGRSIFNKSTFGRSKYGMSTKDVAAQVWGFLKSMGCTDEAAAGIMGNLRQESGMDPTCIQNNGAGPAAGICQWENYNTKSARWANLNKYAKEKGTEWTDLETQMNFMWKELQGLDYYFKANTKMKNYKDLMTCTSVKEACLAFEKAFERAGTPLMEKRYKYAEEYLKEFAGKTGDAFDGSSSSTSSTTTINSALDALNIFNDLGAAYGLTTTSSSTSSISSDISSSSGSVSGDAKSVVDIAKQEVGTKEDPMGSNSIKYNDWYYGKKVSGSSYPWCAAYVSWVADKAGVSKSIIPKDAYTVTMYNSIIGNKNGKSVKTKDGQPGDIAFFAKSGQPSGITHTGIVEDVSNGEVHTIEGNSSDQVIRRSYNVNEKKVLLARPGYTNKSSIANSSNSDSTKYASVSSYGDYSALGTRQNKPISKYGMAKSSVRLNTGISNSKVPQLSRIANNVSTPSSQNSNNGMQDMVMTIIKLLTKMVNDTSNLKSILTTFKTLIELIKDNKSSSNTTEAVANTNAAEIKNLKSQLLNQVQSSNIKSEEEDLLNLIRDIEALAAE